MNPNLVFQELPARTQTSLESGRDADKSLLTFVSTERSGDRLKWSRRCFLLRAELVRMGDGGRVESESFGEPGLSGVDRTSRMILTALSNRGGIQWGRNNEHIQLSNILDEIKLNDGFP